MNDKPTLEEIIKFIGDYHHIQRHGHIRTPLDTLLRREFGLGEAERFEALQMYEKSIRITT